MISHCSVDGHGETYTIYLQTLRSSELFSSALADSSSNFLTDKTSISFSYGGHISVGYIFFWGVGCFFSFMGSGRKEGRKEIALQRLCCTSKQNAPI